MRLILIAALILVGGRAATAGPVPCECSAAAAKCPCKSCVCYPCRCGPKGSASCPCGDDCKPAASAGKYDPYRAESYQAFRDDIVRLGSWFAKNGVTGPGSGGSGVLYVGVPDASVGRYELHCRVESGFGGMADGVYDCWYDAAKCEPVMERRAPLPPVTARPWPAPVQWPNLPYRITPFVTGGS